MDMDEFLDREMGSSQGAKGTPELTGEAATLLASIQYLLAQKQFDQIEASYDSLWGKVKQGNFSWDRKIYDELRAISEQLSRDMGIVYQDTMKKFQIVQQMMARAKSLLSEKQIDGASKLADEATALVAELPSTFFQEKKSLEREVFRLQRDIHEAQSAYALQKAGALQKEIAQQIIRVQPFLLSGNMAAASQSYARLLSLYDQLPPGFLGIKIGLGREMAEMYKSLAIQQEIEGLKQELHPIAQRRLGGTRPATHPVADRHRGQAKALLARKDYGNALAQVNALLKILPDDWEGKEMLERIRSEQRTVGDGI